MNGDLHIHSKYSVDSRLEPDMIAKVAISKRLGFIAITDHNAFQSHKIDGIIFIKGEEISTAEGHVLGLFLQDYVKKEMSQEETVDAIHDRNGIAVSAHPFRSVNGVRNNFKNIYDAIEAKNGRCSSRCNEEALRLSNSLSKPSTAGSDAHFYDEIGRVYMEVNANDEESIRKEIISGRTKLYGNDLDVGGAISLYFKMGKDYILRGFKRI
ncbi:MAG: PHP-associated domain-containing protein [Thermoplasmatales archaeon]